MEGWDGFSLTCTMWQERMKAMGEPAFRGRQIFGWLHDKQVSSYQQMSNLPQTLRERLAVEMPLQPMQKSLVQHSAKDGTRKYLMRLADGESIETVYMRYHYGASLCISSQVGCKMGCRFCASTLSGKVRDLTPGEMVQQIYLAEQDTREKITHVVVMGCGEPFDNYEALCTFLELIHDPTGHGMSLRNITVSTCGLVDRIRDFAQLDLGVTLAVSLHAPNDEIRKKLMPIAHKVPMDLLLQACREYTEITHRRVTFEYALAQGINDEALHAEELADRLSGMLCHVNLIPVNPVTERDLAPSLDARVQDFLKVLQRRHIPVTLRRELGRDIDAACGQLRRRAKEQEEKNESGSKM